MAACVQRAVRSSLDGKAYTAGQANKNVETVNKKVLAALQEMTRNFKWIVTTVISQVPQDGAAGAVLEHTGLWDPQTDGSLVVSWQSKTMRCVVTVFAIAI